MPKIYLASPLGFSPEHKSYLERVKNRVFELGYEVFDPWSLHFGEVLQEASQIKDHYERVRAYDRIAGEIGEANENGIRGCDMLLAVLDGTEVDSGTAAEAGFAAGLGMPVHALRTDWRDCGDFVGLPVNLQIIHFIRRSGGTLFRRIEEIRF